MAKCVTFNLDTEFTVSGLPVLRRDPIENAGSLSILDVASDFSWPKQAAAIVGDQWLSKVGTNFATFNGPIPFSQGFQLASPSDDIISLPPQFLLDAHEAERLIIAWFRHGDQVTGSSGGLGIMSAGAATASQQYGIYCNLVTTPSNGPLMVSADGGGVVHVISASPPDNSLWQVGIHIKLIGGVYVYAVYVNGALAGTYTRTATVLPVATVARVGAYPGASPTWTGKFYRAVSDNMTGGSSVAALVAADYAAYKNTFN